MKRDDGSLPLPAVLTGRRTTPFPCHAPMIGTLGSGRSPYVTTARKFLVVGC